MGLLMLFLYYTPITRNEAAQPPSQNSGPTNFTPLLRHPFWICKGDNHVQNKNSTNMKFILVCTCFESYGFCLGSPLNHFAYWNPPRV